MTILWLRLAMGVVAAVLALWQFVAINQRSAEFRRRGFNGEIAHAMRGHSRSAATRLVLACAFILTSVWRQAWTDQVLIAAVGAVLVWSAWRAITDAREQEILAADRIRGHYDA